MLLFATANDLKLMNRPNMSVFVAFYRNHGYTRRKILHSAQLDHNINKQCGRHGMRPPASNSDLWPFDLETGVRVSHSVCESVGNLPSKFGHARPLGSIYVTVGQTDGRKDKSNAYCPLTYGRVHNKQFNLHRNLTMPSCRSRVDTQSNTGQTMRGTCSKQKWRILSLIHYLHNFIKHFLILHLR